MARSSLTAVTAQLSTANTPFMTAVDGVNGNQFVNPGTELRIAHIVNTGASGSVTACFLANSSYAGVIFPTQTAVVPSSLTGLIFGPFDINAFNQTDGTGDGNVYIDWSGSAYRTTISILAIPFTAS